MSRWKAITLVRDTPDEDLRERLTDALEIIEDARVAADCREGDDLELEIKIFRSDRDEADTRANEAEERLEEKLSHGEKRLAEENGKLKEMGAALVTELARFALLGELPRSAVEAIARFNAVAQDDR
jgi:hypothetical protein